ncbi:MAG: hypothetical protein HKL90_03935 [Elusimicrobia bacterium]|nr:hypothetical protein [Elusimicrobiota bacterium]
MLPFLLRWLLLAWSTVSALICIFYGMTPGRAASTVASGTLWYLLSRHKALSLDRRNLGIADHGRGPLDV